MGEQLQAEYNRLRAEGMSPAHAEQQARFNIQRMAEESQPQGQAAQDVPAWAFSPAIAAEQAGRGLTPKNVGMAALAGLGVAGGAGLAGAATARAAGTLGINHTAPAGAFQAASAASQSGPTTGMLLRLLGRGGGSALAGKEMYDIIQSLRR